MAATMAATKAGQHFAPTYQGLQGRGVSKALVIICRKLARLAFLLLKNYSAFNLEACRQHRISYRVLRGSGTKSCRQPLYRTSLMLYGRAPDQRVPLWNPPC